MKNIEANKDLIAYCGLYCGACPKYLKEKCPGCQKNEKATWCKVRTCCMENKYLSCADCKTYTDVRECKKMNNFISKIFGFIFGSDRNKCIGCIKEKGYEGYAGEMTEKKEMAIKR